MAYTFSGSARRITLPAQSRIDAADLYSRWKEWVATGDNAKFPPAFNVVGGDPISADTSLAVNIFIRNDLGWRLAPPEADIDIVISGNIYPTTASSPWRASPTGAYQTSINTETSVNAVVVTVDSSASSRPTSGLLWPR